MNILGIIPARFGSSRFPGKPLVKIGGKTMIQRVYEQAQKAEKLSAVIVATDHEEIFQTVQDFGGMAVMTIPEHPSGTDRCLEAARKYSEPVDIVINIQGDEPFIRPEQIDQLASLLEAENVELGTLVKPINDSDTLIDPNKVKVVLGAKNRALYFSRSAIPFVKDTSLKDWTSKHTFYKHLGLYGYKMDTLNEISHMQPTALEEAESLEQLRWLENGKLVYTAITRHESLSVDTPEDLKKVELMLQQQPELR